MPLFLNVGGFYVCDKRYLMENTFCATEQP